MAWFLLGRAVWRAGGCGMVCANARGYATEGKQGLALAFLGFGEAQVGEMIDESGLLRGVKITDHPTRVFSK